MEKLKTQKRGALMWGVALSIGFVIGIPMIVLGFMHGGGYIAMAVFGIVLAVCGFYVMPLVWVHFGTLCYYTKLSSQIRDERIRSVKMLAEVHYKTTSVMAFDVKKMIQKDYLPGYVVLDNERIIDKNEMKDADYALLEAKRAGTLTLIHCPFCNAQVEMVGD